MKYKFYIFFWYRWDHLEVLDRSSPWCEVPRSKRPKRPLVKLKLETQRKANFFASIWPFYITYSKYECLLPYFEWFSQK